MGLQLRLYLLLGLMLGILYAVILGISNIIGAGRVRSVLQPGGRACITSIFDWTPYGIVDYAS